VNETKTLTSAASDAFGRHKFVESALQRGWPRCRDIKLGITMIVCLFSFVYPFGERMSETEIGQESLGSRIRRIRMAKGLGQERLAIEAGVDQSGLSKFERGKDRRGFSNSAVERVAKVLGLTFEELVTGTDRV